MISKCINCGNKFFNTNGFCPHCGINITEDKQAKFTCPICKNYINYNSEFCGKCGFKITKDINYIIKESNSKSCPNCNNKNNIDAEFCGNCGNNLPLTSNLQLIECPDCKQMVRDDVNYCRFCGHNFLKGKKSFFPKKPKSYARFCQNCGKQIDDVEKFNFCYRCGTRIPINKEHISNNFTLHENLILILTNKLLVPLSNEYNVNFRKTTVRDYFNITEEQESHIFYKIIEKIKLAPNEDIVQYFKVILDETQNNWNNREDEIIRIAKESISSSFNQSGLTSMEVLTIKDDYYETVETPILQDKHGGLTKGVATLGFGLIGYAATSGVKQTVSTKQVLNKGDYLHSLVTISKKYITVKSYTDDSNLDKFDSTKGNLNKTVIYWKDVNCVDHENYLILNTGETFKLPQYNVENIINKSIDNVVGTLNFELNKQLRNKYYPRIFPIINNLIPKLINETIKNSKEKVIITDNGNSKDGQNNGLLECPNCGKLNDNNNKFCGECGSKLGTKYNYCPNCDKKYDDGGKFCTECGTKLISKSSCDSNSVVCDNSQTENSSNLNKLYDAARRAKESNNCENAIKYYNQILSKDPNSWEAEFYLIYFRSMSCKIIEIGKATNDLMNSFDPIFRLIKKNDIDKENEVDLINEIYDKIIYIANMLFNASKNHYDNIGISKISLSSNIVKMKHSGPYVERSFSVINMLYQFGDNLISVFGNDYYLFSVDSWKQAIDLHIILINDVKHFNTYKDKIDVYVDKINQYDSEYKKPKY